MQKPAPAINTRLPHFLAALLAIILVAYNILRIIYIPVTHDEALTYTHYVLFPYRNILINTPVTANNHILNTLSVKFLVDLFHNEGAFILRLPNLLAQVLYICCGYHLLRLISNNRWYILAGMILLNLNPFLFDFWGLSRGYGLAIGFMMAAIFLFAKAHTTRKPVFIFLSLLAACLATLSNFSILNFYMGLVFIFLLRAYIPRGLSNLSRKWTVAAIVSCTTLLYIMIVQPVLELRQKNEFYFGGSTGFIHDTVGTLVKESFYIDNETAWLKFLSYSLVLIATLASLVTLVKYWKNKEKQESALNLYLLLLFFIPALSTIIQHILLGTLFLIERTALFFYPLFILLLLAGVKAAGYQNTLTRFALWTAAAITCINFISHANIAYAKTWEYDRYDKLVLDRMVAHTPHPVKIKLYWMFSSSFKYYSITTYKDEMAYVENRFETPVYADTAYDYYYIHRQDLEEVPPVYKQDTSFFDGKYILLKKQ